MKIAFITTEAVPFIKTGGLADVAGALPQELKNLNCEIKLFLPKYYSIDETRYELRYCWEIGEINIPIAGIQRSVHCFIGSLPNSNVETYFVDCPHYFHRQFIYTNDFDEDERFILFSKAVIEIIQRLKWKPDILHCNDWQTGLIPLYIKDNYKWDSLFNETATIMTIHNVGYQGRFPARTAQKADIRNELFYPNSPIEIWGDICFLKAGISFADIVTTVSKTYAKEILTAEYGMGLEQTLVARKNDLYGILNGVDYSLWNPETDKYLPARYSKDNLINKLINKSYLMGNMKLPFDEDRPVIGIIARLVSQKGFDIFAEVAHGLLSLDAQWVVLGTGEPQYEELFRHLSSLYPNKIANYIGYNNELSHLIEAGSDMFLMPSKYEPCGLNQIYSLRYGTIPIVRKTGGLADTVYDWDEFKSKGEEIGTGFSFNDYSGYALLTTVERAIKTFHNKPVWKKIQYNGMIQNFSWENAAKEYLSVYKKAKKKRLSNS